MSAVADAARARRLTPDPEQATAHGHPVLRGWRRLDDYVDPKLVGTDPTDQSWVIERVEASDGPAWLCWTLEDYDLDAGYGAEPVFCPRRSDAIDHASNISALTTAGSVIE
jgi:hypothetical protein